MLTWSGDVGPGTIFAAIGAISGVGTAIFVAIKGLGIREADAKALARRFEAAEDRVDRLEASDAEFREWIYALKEEARKEREQFQVAVNAGLEHMRTNLSDSRREAAERYATKAEVVSLEDRTNKGMDRIVDRLEQISGRLETIGDAIIKTLTDQRRG